jgi:hypothetical protein
MTTAPHIKIEEKKSRRHGIENLIPAKKGQILNPHGRPPKSRCYADIAREMLAAKDIDLVLTAPNGTKKQIGLSASHTMYHAIIMGQIREALKGNTSAAKELIDRVEGKVKDQIELSGNHREVVELVIPDNRRNVPEKRTGELPPA